MNSESLKFELVQKCQSTFSSDFCPLEFDLKTVLPEAELISCIDQSNIVYHGKECSFSFKQLYRYKGFCIIYRADGEGEDTDMYGIEAYVLPIQLGAPKMSGKQLSQLFWSRSLHVMREEDFDNDRYLTGTESIDDIATFFAKFYHSCPAPFLEYCGSIFEKCCN
uniref:Uncharacterized protein n=1 Tax=viral metagenome TaxID=1070528 RepID=A0A6C0EJM3_9ZZZZ